jgi:hypothetical protein
VRAGDRHLNFYETRDNLERGDSLLKTTFKAPRRVCLYPWRICADE